MNVTGILFDKDGTLFDFNATYAPACASVVRELAGGDSERAARMAASVGFDLDAGHFAPELAVIAGCTADLAHAWAEFMPSPPPDFANRIDALFELHSRHTASLFPGVPELLGRLAGAGLHLGIATNDAETNARAHVEAAGLGGLLGFVAGYDSGYGAKPGPGMVQAFARHCRCYTAKVVMVGDSRRDMAAARTAGAIAVAVTTGPADRRELAPYADFVIDGVGELASLPLIGLTGSTA